MPPKKFKHSSTFYRKLAKELSECRNESLPSSSQAQFNEDLEVQTPVDMNFEFNLCEEAQVYEDEDDEDEILNIEINISLINELRKWALQHKITHAAMANLLKILKKSGHNTLPSDSRCIMKTPHTVETKQMGMGQYWYHGIKNALSKQIESSDIDTNVISVAINVDGLPPFASAKVEFWPILGKIIELPKSKPFVIALYAGTTKPPLQNYFEDFVNETKSITHDGVIINNKKVNVKIKYFVCDTPARSFIKGVVGFNATHGCIKCTAVGVYDRGGKHMSFPNTTASVRTDEEFRNMTDPLHHKEPSPLTQLSIDMVNDFIIADSLHLIDLGVVRKCLYWWVNGSYNYKNKMSSQEIDALSISLVNCNSFKPAEIHRAIRGLQHLKFWKGTEYRTFLLYLGIVILKDYFHRNVYNHFVTLASAITILSCNYHLKHIDISEKLLTCYVEEFKMIYGVDSISMNVHNLCHVVNDVKKFGNLTSISAYSFENYLGNIKSLIRSGHKPVQQCAKRIIELELLQTKPQEAKKIICGPSKIGIHPHPDCVKIINKVNIYDEYILKNDKKNCWFLTTSNEIVCFVNATIYKEKLVIYGKPVCQKEDFFKLPDINSSLLHIYQSDGKTSLSGDLYNLDKIKCKLISLKYSPNLYVFMPILHTLDVVVK